jgi:hypothetical protein
VESIGRPIANTLVYILDAQRQPVPIGLAGELYIGGAGLGRGYLNRPELTAEKFVANPFGEPGSRLYRTGDLARYRADGNIEFLGRMDQQVKIRGFRIELGEIESVLDQHPGVARSVVTAREVAAGDRRLVAYVVAATAEMPTVDELRSFLKQKLPEYMLPSAFVPLERLPLTLNGKVDRRALPAPDQARPDLATGYAAPRDAVEKQLASVWAEVLGLERVGIHDDFFDLGGHSLLAMQLISRANSVLQAGLTVRDIFESPTLAGLAQRAGESRGPQGERKTPRIGRLDRQAYRQKRGPE